MLADSPIAGTHPDSPSWPSLYTLSDEILAIEHRPPQSERATYLYHPEDVFLFTLYWTLIFYLPTFALAGFYAFFNLAFPPVPSKQEESAIHPGAESTDDVELHSLIRQASRTTTNRAKPNERRSRLAFATLVLLFYGVLSLLGATLGSAVVGFILAGLFQAGGFYMSTWVPFFWALIFTLVGLLSVWSSVIDIL